MTSKSRLECDIQQLPSEIIEKVLSNCNYDTISIARQVCKVFDQCGQQLLNQGFSKVDKYHIKIQKLVKGKLPRRESERRNHPLAKHVNALSAIETRLSLLNMTYVKYIDMGICCFIPGKVLDEMFVVLKVLEDISTQPRTHELLQELRDISSMAMEHFDEKIVPVIRKNMPSASVSLSTTLPVPSTPVTPASGFLTDIHGLSWSTPSLPLARQPIIRQEINQIKNTLRSTTCTVYSLKKDVTGNKDLSNKIIDMQKKISEQDKVIAEQNSKITEHEKRLQDLNQSVVEYDHKFNELFSEITRLRSELGMEASASKVTNSLEQKISYCCTEECDITESSVIDSNISLKRKIQDDPLPNKRVCQTSVSTGSPVDQKD